MQTFSGNIVQILGNITTNLEDLLLTNRGISPDEQRSFFEPTLDDLHDPWTLPDMKEGVDRILEAREKKERIVIFGDYDVDGVTATTILVRYLTNI